MPLIAEGDILADSALVLSRPFINGLAKLERKPSPLMHDYVEQIADKHGATEQLQGKWLIRCFG
jgi:hypothetical protein